MLTAKLTELGVISRTLILPIRLAMLAAQSVDAAETMLVTKKMEPSLPSCSENFCLKKYVTHDLLPNC